MTPLVDFLRTWLAGHVHDHDRRFIDFVKAQGGVAVLPEPWASDPPTPNGRVV